MKFSTLIIPTVLMLTACSEFQHYSSTGFAPVTSKGYGADYWLTEVHETRAMTPEQRQVTLELWKQEYGNSPSISNRLRLALLLAAGDKSIRNPERALELLEGLVPEPENAGDRELILMLRQFIGEQLKAEVTINDFKKLTINKDRQIKELEQKQQALTNIEQNIQQRENQPEAGNDSQ